MFWGRDLLFLGIGNLKLIVLGFKLVPVSSRRVTLNIFYTLMKWCSLKWSFFVIFWSYLSKKWWIWADTGGTWYGLSGKTVLMCFKFQCLLFDRYLSSFGVFYCYDSSSSIVLLRFKYSPNSSSCSSFCWPVQHDLVITFPIIVDSRYVFLWWSWYY